MSTDKLLENAGWNENIPPNDFINRPKSVQTKDNPAKISAMFYSQRQPLALHPIHP